MTSRCPPGLQLHLPRPTLPLRAGPGMEHVAQLCTVVPIVPAAWGLAPEVLEPSSSGLSGPHLKIPTQRKT